MDNTITIYLKDLAFKNILTFSFPTDNSMAKNTIKFEKKDKDEIILSYLNHDNRFYVLSNSKNSSKLQLYKFSYNSYDILEYDFSSERFYSEDEKSTNLYTLLQKQEISIIENDIPSSIEETSKKFKLYKQDNEFLITLNHRKNNTKIIHLDFDNPQNSKVDLFFIPVAAFKYQVFSNSLVHKNRLFQFLASKNDFFMQVFELNSKELLKEYKFTRDYNNIPFSNSPLYIGNGSIASELDEIYETNKFLKYISSKHLGAMAYEKNGNLILTIGGLYTINSGGGMMFPGGGGFYGAGNGMVNTAVNPVFWMYDSYSTRSAVFTRCLFDMKNLEHQKGFAPINVFDLISIYKKQDIKDLKTSLETIYKYDDFYVLGYFNLKSEEYAMIKF